MVRLHVCAFAYFTDALLQQATEEVASFIYSSDHDLKYLGLKALNDIISIDKKYADDENIKMAVRKSERHLE